ncbi:hypothetical protein SAMN05443662_0218 [Sulfurivirga caldicuralii]|uniref:Uncharacterized protein n=1 Tax=Sulfurivirga caldicuralii TaxID=364032 RepID=A0A1N6DKC3_9GAMM|nr:hypothetical protein [Sulfurivirga caldicuralii]SIN71232.1 hypothetical protein SAMN05443662_0218 [Sulfurivirga caldicuralii]
MASNTNAESKKSTATGTGTAEAGKPAVNAAVGGISSTDEEVSAVAPAQGKCGADAAAKSTATAARKPAPKRSPSARKSTSAAKTAAAKANPKQADAAKARVRKDDDAPASRPAPSRRVWPD